MAVKMFGTLTLREHFGLPKALPIPAPLPDLESVEQHIRAFVFSTRLRLDEFFRDFDKLRTGFVTAPQFRRCLALGLQAKCGFKPLKEQEVDVIVAHYADASGARVNYSKFVENIDKVFTVKFLETRPGDVQPLSHTPIPEPRVPFESKDNNRFETAMERVIDYVKCHESRPKFWFKDFDKHNAGVVTIPQFRRGFPENLVTPDEIELFIQKFGNEYTKQVSYRHFDSELDAEMKARQQQKERALKDQLTSLAPPLKPQEPENPANAGPDGTDHLFEVPIGTERVLFPGGGSSTVKPKENHAFLSSLKVGVDFAASQRDIREEAEDVIKREIFARRVRLNEFFKDFDRHNSGVVTENQFRSGFKAAGLSLPEAGLKALVAAYRTPDGRVNYRRFCKTMDTVFTSNVIESDPVLEVSPPPATFLVKEKNYLTPEEENRTSLVLDDLRSQIRKRRVLLTPLFRDFDKNLGNNGKITQSHFARLLASYSLRIAEEDVRLLCRKYMNLETGHVNYMSFLQAIDPTWYPPGSGRTDAPAPSSAIVNVPPPITHSIGEESVDVAKVLEGLKLHVATRRVRAHEFFRDFDPLRSGHIARSDFTRALARIGHPLAPRELEAIADHYAGGPMINASDRAPGIMPDPRGGKRGWCLWMKFCDDVDQVFGPKHLEATPSSLPKLVDRQTLDSSKNKTILNVNGVEVAQLVSQIAEAATRHNILTRPGFRDFDIHNSGRITAAQFRQCLASLGFRISDKAFNALRVAYSDQRGDVRYKDFLASIVPDEVAGVPDPLADVLPNNRFADQTFASRRLEDEPQQSPPPEPVNVDKLLYRMKCKVKTEGIRPLQFLQSYDPLRHGRVPRSDFRRAVKAMSFELDVPSFVALEEQFRTQGTRSVRGVFAGEFEVDYLSFCEEMEGAVVKKGMIADPLSEPPSFHVARGAEAAESASRMNPAEREAAEGVVEKLSEKARKRRMEPYFGDHDKIHNGTVTRGQFRTVLEMMNLKLDDREASLVCDRFAVSPGGDVDYLEFLEMLDFYRIKGEKNHEIK